MVQYVSTASTWISWTSNTASFTATSTSTNYYGSTWQAWTSVPTYTATTSATITTSWQAWNVPRVARDWYTPAVETAEERVARELIASERRGQYAREEKLRKEARRVAISKADRLLESVLNDVQRAQLQRDSAFLLRSQSGKIYRLRKGRSGNVDEICPKTGAVVKVLCAHPTMDVPDGDTVVAQKLMLECAEQEFLRLANKHTVRGPKVSLDELNRLVMA